MTITLLYSEEQTENMRTIVPETERTPILFSMTFMRNPSIFSVPRVLLANRLSSSRNCSFYDHRSSARCARSLLPLHWKRTIFDASTIAV